MSRAEVMLAEEELAEVNELLADAAPTEILRWAVERYHPRLTMATAFGPEGCILIHLLAEVEPRMHVFNLDTGYQFPETLALRDRIADRYGIEVELVRPDTSVQEYESLHGGPLYVSNSERCCYGARLSRYGGLLSVMTRGSRRSGRNSRRIAPRRRSSAGIPSSAW